MPTEPEPRQPQSDKDGKIVLRLERWRKGAWVRASRQQQGRTLAQFIRDAVDAAATAEGVTVAPRTSEPSSES